MADLDPGEVTFIELDSELNDMVVIEGAEPDDKAESETIQLITPQPQPQHSPPDASLAKSRPSILDIGTPATTDLGLGYDYGPYRYLKLPEPYLSEELARLAGACVRGREKDVDVVSFQPSCIEADRSQDRWAVEDWVLGEEEEKCWSFRCVFDGHAGHETADYTQSHLLPFLKARLQPQLSLSPLPTPNEISTLLASAITAFDNSIAQALLDLFPGGVEALEGMSDEKIRAVINDDNYDGKGGENMLKVLRCMRGTTALVTLLDPQKENLWVAGLGDCSAVLCTTSTNDEEGVKPTARVLTAHHNGKNTEEVERIRTEHPGEPDCIFRNRVLGSIAITRALGDHLFKLPLAYTTRVFMNCPGGFLFRTTQINDILPRIQTPPYLSNVPEVKHVDLREVLAGIREKGDNDEAKAEVYLVLCSDGLTDVFAEQGGGEHVKSIQEVADLFPTVLSKAAHPSSNHDERPNLALALLREGLGGSDLDKVSSMITLELDSKWIDDVTVLVQRL